MGGPDRRSLLLSGWILAVLVHLAGTFLPWLYSGRVAKNSYELAGFSQRRLSLPGWMDVALAGWGLLGPLWAVAAVVLVLGVRQAAAVRPAVTRTAAVRVAAVLSAVLAVGVLVIGSVAVSSVTGAGTTLITAAWPGPVLTGLGAVAAAVTAMAMALRTRPTRRRMLP